MNYIICILQSKYSIISGERRSKKIVWKDYMKATLQLIIEIINKITDILYAFWDYRTVYKVGGLFVTRRFRKNEEIGINAWWNRVGLGWNLFFAIAYSVLTVGSFAVNLLLDGTLSWCWIVLFGVLFAAVFTVVPQFLGKQVRVLVLSPAGLVAWSGLTVAYCLYNHRPWWVWVVSIAVAALAAVIAILLDCYFKKHPRFPEDHMVAYHKYAILVAARNEAGVIGNLIESIQRQDYPSDQVAIFVVADNCTDNTAQVARDLGAICYERFDEEHRTKGFALQYLVECIRRDYGIETYEGYFLFDADNLLKRDYISRMNESFDAGEKIITSYRNTKNFGDNWISASYGIHWLRTVRTEHRARSFLHLATRIQGTGFLFTNEMIRDGWNYTSLTEDRAFCADAVAKGYKISYNDEAEFYDEQPVDMKIAMRQRIRWSKGHLQAFAETGPKLFAHIFYTGGMANKEKVDRQGRPVPLWKRLFNNLRLRFMSFDMLTLVFPLSLVSFFKKVVVYGLRVAIIINAGLWIKPWYAPDSVEYIFEHWFHFQMPATDDIAACIFWLAFFTFCWTVTSYISSIWTAVYIYVIEHKRIMPIKWYKKVWYCITFPLFDAIGRLTNIIALFKKVEWKPIPHQATIKIEDIEHHQ